MRKKISFILLICISLSLVACGNSNKGLTSEQLQRYEGYALGTTGTYSFRASQTINGISVIVPDDMVLFLSEQVGDVSHLELDDAEALVFDYADSVSHVYVVSGQNAVLFHYAEGDMAGATAATPAATVAPKSSSKFGSTLSALRNEYARIDVELDKFDERYSPRQDEQGTPENNMLAKINELKQELGVSYFLDHRYIALESEDESLLTRADNYLQALYHCSLYIEQKEALENNSGTAKTDEEIETMYSLEIAKRDLLRELNQTERRRANVEAAALLVLAENEELINEIKQKTKEKKYMDDLAFYQLCEKNETLKQYANYLRLKEAQENFLQVYAQLFMEPADIVNLTLEKHVALADNASQQNICRSNLAKAIIAEQLYQETHAQEIADYEIAAEEIKTRFGDPSYEESNDYLKLNIVNDNLLNDLEKNRAAVKDAERALEEKIAAASQIESEKTLAIENAILANYKMIESQLLNDFLKQQAESLIPNDEGNHGNETTLSGWQSMNKEFVAKMNAERKIYTPPAPRSSGGSSSSSTKKCQFTDAFGNESCTRNAMSGGVLCQYHFNELDKVYKSLTR